MTIIAVATDTPDLRAQAKELAKQLQLPFVVEKPSTGCDYFLLLTPDYWCIQDCDYRFNPIIVDFSAKPLTHRREHAGFKTELIAKALGLHKKREHLPSIIDATAGFGQDSFILASLGASITLLERSPILYALLQNGLTRGRSTSELAPVLNRLHLLNIDAITYLKSLKSSEHPDIIFLDPLFPERKKSALNKKEMRILHDILGEDEDADQLLVAALSCAKERVVVKRPRLAPFLGLLAPTYSLKGRTNRFDVYIRK